MPEQTTGIGFSPQIGRLTPEDFKSQSRLDRLSDFLRSLILIPGQGMSIRRDGSAGTVIDGPQFAQPAVDNRRPALYYDSGADEYVVDLPTVKYQLQSGTGLTEYTLTGVQWRFTSGYPNFIMLIGGMESRLELIHNSANGVDATTQAAYFDFTSYNSVAFAWKYSSSINQLPYLLSVAPSPWQWEMIRSQRKICLSPMLSHYFAGVWRDNVGAGDYGSMGYSTGITTFTGGYLTLPASATVTIYLTLPDNWYYTGDMSLSYKDNLGTDQRTTGKIYCEIGTVVTDASKIVSASGPKMPNPYTVPTLNQVSQSATYLKTLGGATGTVTSVKGVVTGIT